MKQFIWLATTCLILLFSGTIFAQTLHIVYLNQNNDNYVNPFELTVNPGDQVKFVSTSGDFDITIQNANTIFTVSQSTLTIKLTSSNPESHVFTVRSVEAEINQPYSVYCVSSGGVPDAPPRIIIQSGD